MGVLEETAADRVVIMVTLVFCTPGAALFDGMWVLLRSRVGISS